MKRVFNIIAAISMVALVGCCGCRAAKSQNPYTLTDYKWKLYELNGGVKFADTEHEQYNIIFNQEDGQVQGQAACNSFFMPYATSEVRKLKLSEGGLTRALCQDSRAEQIYIQTLSTVDSYTIDGDMLMLQKDGEVVAIFTAAEKIK